MFIKMTRFGFRGELNSYGSRRVCNQMPLNRSRLVWSIGWMEDFKLNRKLFNRTFHAPVDANSILHDDGKKENRWKSFAAARLNSNEFVISFLLEIVPSDMLHLWILAASPYPSSWIDVYKFCVRDRSYKTSSFSSPKKSEGLRLFFALPWSLHTLPS